jgi:hypothetical protein
MSAGQRRGRTCFYFLRDRESAANEESQGGFFGEERGVAVISKYGRRFDLI